MNTTNETFKINNKYNQELVFNLLQLYTERDFIVKYFIIR